MWQRYDCFKFKRPSEKTNNTMKIYEAALSQKDWNC